MQVYKELLDVEFLYDVSYGLAMEKALHHAYDAYRWSIYYKFRLCPPAGSPSAEHDLT